MNTRWINAIGVAVAAAGLVGFASGCDDAETDTALGIDPPSSTVYADGATVFLTAYDPDAEVYAMRAKDAQDSGAGTSSNLSSHLLLPLEWSVSNPAMGRIMASGGYSAVYESYGPRGQNYITVRDQAGREGIAAVEQRWQEGDPEGTEDAAAE